MENIQFVSVQYIKDNTSMNNNVDADVVEPHIITVQATKIEQILGTKLYEKIQNDISGNTVSGNYQILLEKYIQPTLAHWVLYEVYPFLNYKLTNKSIVTKNSDNSEAIDLETLKYMRYSVRDTAEYFSQRISNYLLANQTLFPEYFLNSQIDEIRPKRTNYFSGLYLGNDCDSICDFGVDYK